MQIPFKESFESVLKLDRPIFLLLDTDLKVMVHSDILSTIIDIAEQEKELTIYDIFSQNDCRIIQNRIADGRYNEGSIYVSLTGEDGCQQKFNLKISSVQNPEGSYYLLSMHALDNLYSETNIGENIEKFIELFRRIFENTPYGIMLFSQKNQVIYFNKWFQKFTRMGYLELSSYDDMVKNLHIEEVKSPEESAIKLWSITNKEKVTIHFTAVFINLPAGYYMIFLIPGSTEGAKENLSPYNTKYLIMSNHGLTVCREHYNNIRSIINDIAEIRSKTRNGQILDILNNLEKMHNQLFEKFNRIFAIHSSLFSTEYYNITQSIASLIALFSSNDKKRIILETSQEHSILSFFNEQMFNMFSIIIEDIYAGIKNGSCSVSIHEILKDEEGPSERFENDCIAISFCLSGEIDYDNLLIGRLKESKLPYACYIRSFLSLIKADTDITGNAAEGMRFTIYIPRDKKCEMLETASASNKPGKIGILLADDEESVRNIGRMMLEMMGFTVYTAKDGSEAVSEFKDNINDIRLAILDIIMPKLDGQQVFRLIRSLKPETKVLLTSGYYTESVLKGMLKEGEASYMVKPFTFEELAQNIENLLDIS